MIGFGKRISYAFKSFFGILSSGALPRDVAHELIEPQAAAAPALEEPTAPCRCWRYCSATGG